MEFNRRSSLQFLCLLDRALLYYLCLPEGETGAHTSLHGSWAATDWSHCTIPRPYCSPKTGFPPTLWSILGFQALFSCLKGSEGSVSFPSWTGSHALWSFLTPQEWSLMAAFLTSMWTTSRFPRSSFPVCDWSPGRLFFFPKNLHFQKQPP